MKTLFLSAFTFLYAFTSYAQSGDAIIGVWLSEKKDSKIEIYKKGSEYFGKIIWLKNDRNDDGTSPKKDINNPNEKLRNRSVKGMDILTDLEWDAGDNEWNEGEIYDPRSGNIYSMLARLENKNTLFLKGYIGISLIGRSTTWTRVD